MNSIIEKELYDVESRRVTNEEYLLNRQNSIPQPDSFINYPDAKKHQIVSFIKSGIRIFGYILIPINLLAAAIVLIVSEVIGIVEELV
tara:strand:+ start:481 stop:744 length:264 start_codon:yes stop_codon:yes gene_type:complete